VGFSKELLPIAFPGQVFLEPRPGFLKAAGKDLIFSD
jgi:hypothetical protein